MQEVLVAVGQRGTALRADNAAADERVAEVTASLAQLRALRHDAQQRAQEMEDERVRRGVVPPATHIPEPIH